MSTETPHQTVPAVTPQAPYRHLLHVHFWMRELPFALVLILTTVGVAYMSFSKKPITGYWEFLAPLIALVCVGAGWESADDNAKRLRLIGTQVLHWIAFIVVMNMMLLESVQREFNSPATALAIFTLLALGIPAIAWIENSALLLVLVVGAVAGIVAVFWWRFHEGRRHAA